MKEGSAGSGQTGMWSYGTWCRSTGSETGQSIYISVVWHYLPPPRPSQIYWPSENTLYIKRCRSPADQRPTNGSTFDLLIRSIIPGCFSAGQVQPFETKALRREAIKMDDADEVDDDDDEDGVQDMQLHHSSVFVVYYPPLAHSSAHSTCSHSGTSFTWWPTENEYAWIREPASGFPTGCSGVIITS